MWPWEHAAVGYVAFSILVHLSRSRPPTGFEALTVVFASVLPDLIDKPLAWEFGVFPSGYGLAHSIFFAVPLTITVLFLTMSYGRPNLGLGFSVGYLLHLSMDVLPTYARTGRVPIERVLWPARTSETSYPGGFSGTFISYFRDYFATFFSGDPSGYVVVVTGLMIGCLLLWIYDGLPGVREPVIFALKRR